MWNNIKWSNMVETGDRKRKKMIFKENMAKISPNLFKNNHSSDFRYMNSKWNKYKENYIYAHHHQTASFSLEAMEVIIQ